MTELLCKPEDVVTHFDRPNYYNAGSVGNHRFVAPNHIPLKTVNKKDNVCVLHTEGTANISANKSLKGL